jgi:hypothetical protein
MIKIIFSVIGGIVIGYFTGIFQHGLILGAGSLVGLLAGFAVDIVKDWLDTLKQERLAKHKLDIDKQKQELNITQDNNIEPIQENITDNSCQSQNNEDNTDNITKATTGLLEYDVALVKQIPYTSNKLGNIACFIGNLLINLINACNSLISCIKYLREINSVTRPILAGFLTYANWKITLIILNDPNVDKDLKIYVVENIVFLTEFAISFWFYGRQSEKRTVKKF